MDSPEALTQKILLADERAIARAISLVERGAPEARTLLAAIYRSGGNARLIGITGAPGAGKSTLVDRLARQLAGTGKRVAVLAVDPSSPFTGGAVLGDRIRMSDAATVSGIYIRSLATRGALGGIAHATRYAAAILDAAGFDFILIETVGVGQAEVDIVKVADLTAVVLVPGMGDTVQTLKAGILEIADVFILNKADYEGADRLLTELRALNELSGKQTPIVKTVALQGEGIAELWSALLSGLGASTASGELDRRRRVAAEGLLLERVRDLVVDKIVAQANSSPIWSTTLQQVSEHQLDPEGAAHIIVSAFAK